MENDLEKIKAALKPIFDISIGINKKPISYSLILTINDNCKIELSEFLAKNISKKYELLLENQKIYQDEYEKFLLRNY